MLLFAQNATVEGLEARPDAITSILQSRSVPPLPIAHLMEAFLQEVQALFEQDLDPGSFLSISERLQEELEQHLALNPSQCMLPSFNYNLPTGQEQGEYLALEVGGSNLRMALVELRRRRRMTGPSSSDMPIHIQRSRAFAINNAVRQLQGYEFFDWMAAKIGEFLPGPSYANRPLRMGVAWSFPLESVHAIRAFLRMLISI